MLWYIVTMQMTRMKIEIKMLRLVMGMVIMSRIGTAASVASLCVQAPPIYSPPVGPGGRVGGFHIKYDPHIFTSRWPSIIGWCGIISDINLAIKRLEIEVFLRRTFILAWNSLPIQNFINLFVNEMDVSQYKLHAKHFACNLCGRQE